LELSPEYWGIDIGGTKIEAVAFSDVEKPIIKSRMRVPTEHELGYDHLVKQIRLVLDLMQKQTGSMPTRVGVSVPGCIDWTTQKIKNSFILDLNGKNLGKDLQAIVSAPVVIANDANCLTLAETKYGAVAALAPNAKVVFGMIMSKGVGGGWMFGGQLYNGRHNIAGEWGHNFLDTSGGPCHCGKIGCVETIISGPALEQYYYDLTGEHKDIRSIYESSTFGNDPASAKTIKRLITFFGLAVSNIIHTVDPEVIVIGGELSYMQVLFEEGVEAVLSHLFNNKVETLFLKPKLGDSASVFGAAYLASVQP
jgi:fructokinase